MLYRAPRLAVRAAFALQAANLSARHFHAEAQSYGGSSTYAEAQSDGGSSTHAQAKSHDGRSSTHAAMARLFDGLPDVHEIPVAEEDAIDASGGHEGYGELCIAGTAALLLLLRPSDGDVLYDLGSGAGRVLAQIALEAPTLRAVGIELSPSRHAVACAAIARVESPHRCEARLGDLLAAPCDDATVVFIAGLLFDDGEGNKTTPTQPRPFSGATTAFRF